MTGRLLSLSLLVLTSSAFASVRPKMSNNPLSIRVKIAKDLGEVQVSGLDLERVIHTSKNRKSFSGRKRIRFNCKRLKNKNAKNDVLKKPLLLASLKSSTGLVSFNEGKFQGQLHVVTNPKEESCDVVNEVPIDNYISSLLSKEMNASWHIEALKAQAVAARSYAAHKIFSKQVKRGYGYEAYYDLENSEKHQVSGSFFDATKRTAKAAFMTSGEVLVAKDGSVVPTFFHASCGGTTLAPNHVWENRVKGYKRVRCGSCSDKNHWDGVIKKERFNKFLSWLKRKKVIKAKSIKNVRVISAKETSTHFRVYIGDRPYRIKKSYFRRYFGRKVVGSNNFKIGFNKRTKNIHLEGKGLGHGVGLCQVGAKRYAQKDWTYKQILKHYYPNLKLVKLY